MCDGDLIPSIIKPKGDWVQDEEESKVGRQSEVVLLDRVAETGGCGVPDRKERVWEQEHGNCTEAKETPLVTRSDEGSAKVANDPDPSEEYIENYCCPGDTRDEANC